MKRFEITELPPYLILYIKVSYVPIIIITALYLELFTSLLFSEVY